jgi:hypothetical protein
MKVGDCYDMDGKSFASRAFIKNMHEGFLDKLACIRYFLIMIFKVVSLSIVFV